MATRCGLILLIVVIFACGLVAGRFLLKNDRTVLAGTTPSCETGDLNIDGSVDVSDAVFLLLYLFELGAAPTPCVDVESVSTVIVVRHAERDAGSDPPLNKDGIVRAERLAEMLTGLEIDHLIASDLIRTQQTLEPTSTLKNDLPIEQIANAKGVADRVRSFTPGETTVIAHHSFTIRSILRNLGFEDSDIEDVNVIGDNYDNFLIVRLPAHGDPQLVHLHY